MRRKADAHELLISDQEILQAISTYVALNDLEEARSVYEEAQRGNRIAQFIVGNALLTTNHVAVARAWLRLSAHQGFSPALQRLEVGGEVRGAGLLGRTFVSGLR